MEAVIEQEKLLSSYECSKLANRNIILFLLGKLVSLFGSSIYSFAIGLYVLKTTGSGTSFALTIVLATIPRAILGPVSGVLADKLDKKKLVVILDMLSGIIVLALVVASSIDGLRIGYIYAATLLLNITNVFFDTTISASIPLLVDKERLTRINSFSGSISNLAYIIGPALGGFVFGVIDMKVFLILNGLSFIFSGISEMFLDFKVKEKIYGVEASSIDNAESSFVNDLVDGFKYMFKTKWLLALAISATFINMFMTLGMNIPIPYIMKQYWTLTDLQYGITMASFPFGVIIASLVVGIIPPAKKNYNRIIGGMIVFAIVMICFGLLTRFLPITMNNWGKVSVMVVLFITIASGSAFMNIPLMVTIQSQTPSDMLGRVMGVLVTIASVMTPIGALLGGILIDRLPPWLLPLGCGLVLVLLTIIVSGNKDLQKV
ncbi:MFS transporter [Acidaminobacter sp. JC074]|uniref:MFS transporter n=1 Tax=Acidaminobacter sp. JC074 TaxID=2530199 RepID=UPI001F0EBAC4|nr:MFS transporter [Acidaminobacter sp. JC074]MCH4886111.1 MFS transporter [Acidaminobacter sp. JC074]